MVVVGNRQASRALIDEVKLNAVENTSGVFQKREFFHEIYCTEDEQEIFWNKVHTTLNDVAINFNFQLNTMNRNQNKQMPDVRHFFKKQ